jgi:hypothetical protein
VGDVLAPDVRHAETLDLDNREAADDRLGRGAGDAELRLELLRVEEFGQSLAHVDHL